MARKVCAFILLVLPCIVMCSPAHMSLNDGNLAVDEISDFEEGDIVADNSAYMEQSSGKLKISLRDNARLWPGGNVSFSIFDREDEPNTYDLVMTAIIKMNADLKGCVVIYLEDDPENDYIDIVFGDSLSSQLGHQRNGAQKVTITRKDDQPNLGLNLGSIQHELMHSIGFGHEHNRDDRDKYVKVLWDNLKKGDKEPYFQKYGNPGNFSYDNLLDYDFNSIMHSTRYIESLSLDKNKPVIERLNTDADGSLGQRDHLTDLDIKRVRMTYSCDICNGQNEGGIFRYPGDCKQYYECVNGKPMTRPCPSNLHINTVTNPDHPYCDYPRQAGCTELEDLFTNL